MIIIKKIKKIKKLVMPEWILNKLLVFVMDFVRMNDIIIIYIHARDVKEAMKWIIMRQ